MFLPDALALAAPDALALDAPDGRLCYADLASRARGVAARLRDDLGIGAGDIVATLAGNTAGHAVRLHACAMLGAVCAPLNPRLTARELAERLAIVDPRVILADAALMSLAAAALDMYSSQNAAQRSEPPHISLPTLMDIDAAAASVMREGALPAHEWRSDETAWIVFTSGSTAVPKAVPLTCGNILSSARASTRVLGSHPGDLWLSPIPLFHVGGLSVLARCALDGTAALLPPSSSAEELLVILRSEPVTLVSLVPTVFRRLLDTDASFTGANFPQLRAILLGGAHAADDLLHDAAARALPVLCTYGLTEAASQVATMPLRDADRKRGSAGLPLDGFTVTIRDDNGTAVPAGERGEICIAGPQVMAHYLGAEMSSSSSVGYFRTGDLGRLDDEGFLYVEGRIDDMIITGGENVAPAEIENVLRQHPQVRDVCVIGLPDREWGQCIAAAIVARDETPAAAELETWCRAALASYKIPKRWIFVRGLPLTESGKVQRHAVMDLFNDQPAAR